VGEGEKYAERCYGWRWQGYGIRSNLKKGEIGRKKREDTGFYGGGHGRKGSLNFSQHFVLGG